ncbi:hypothetical protein HDU89_008249 [Geranomyces variabilis]|nr:hypothetical protein HDU89_008249 [Geranomyces variabilis]
MTAWLQKGCGVVIDTAARHGHLECVKLLAETTDFDATLALQSAVECVSPSYKSSVFHTTRYDPFLSTDTWVYDPWYPQIAHNPSAPVNGQNIITIKYCLDRGGDPTTRLVSALQFGGSIEQVVELLLSIVTWLAPSAQLRR